MIGILGTKMALIFYLVSNYFTEKASISHSKYGTDLGSLIGFFDRRNSTDHSVEISNFLATLILREINFGSFQKVKNWHFKHFESFAF